MSSSTPPLPRGVGVYDRPASRPLSPLAIVALLLVLVMLAGHFGLHWF